MDYEKSSKTLYQSLFGWWPRVELGKAKSELELPVKQEGAETRAEASEKRKTKWRVWLIRWAIATVLVLAVKVYFLGGWPIGWKYNFKVENEPEPAAEGSVCDLFRELEEQHSTLLKTPGEEVIYHRDTVSESGVESTIDIKIYHYPEKGLAAEEALPSIADINLDDLIHFEILTQHRARLVFVDGNCEVYDLGEVLRFLRDEDGCHLFQAIPYDGKAYEYFNIMYTESFEKIKCEEGTFYRARLNIPKARCPAGNSLVNCGTDFFSAHIYRKVRERLEIMDPNSDYSFKREYELFPCKCVGDEGEAAPAAEPEVIVIDGETDIGALMEGVRLDTVDGGR